MVRRKKDDLPGAEVKVLITYDDYCELPNDGKRYEILDGELYVTPSPATNHQRVILRLVRELDRHGISTRGELFTAPYDVVLDDTTVVQPDALFVSNEQKSIITKANVRGAPNLMIEVLSPRTRKTDCTIKLASYEKHGVANYWILDPDERTLDEYALVKGKFRLISQLSGPVKFTPRVFSDLTLSLKDVWAE